MFVQTTVCNPGGRLTADVTQVMMRMQEDAEDLHRREESGSSGGVK